MADAQATANTTCQKQTKKYGDVVSKNMFLSPADQGIKSSTNPNPQIISGKAVLVQRGELSVKGFFAKGNYEPKKPFRASSEYEQRFQALQPTSAGSAKKTLCPYHPNAPRNRLYQPNAKKMNSHHSQLKLPGGSLKHMKSESQDQFRGFNGGAHHGMMTNPGMYAKSTQFLRSLQLPAKK